MKSVMNCFVGESIVVLATAGMALVCASLVACESHASVGESARAAMQPTAVAVDPLAGLEPRPPFDETPITPVETVGASSKDR